ncbi:hypothetical protein EFE32_03945 [Lactococcus lactis subsp. lactis]|uniref:hypothetical protein n=1 Tax=Lactococcus lactis TaxID=1358 RepID=UPI00223BE5E0|nr:hypothetical protein [Lactococcus lactis]MCT0016019.1 hypothetical protein [Lactococcus lactis subsp. lactis]
MAFEIGGITSTGRLLQWDGNTVAINKINSVDLSFSTRKFPLVALVGGSVGLLLLTKTLFLGIILLVACTYYIYWWSKNKEYNYTVNLRTSSTEPFTIYFGNNVNVGRQVKSAILEEIANL